jgi:beclin
MSFVVLSDSHIESGPGKPAKKGRAKGGPSSSPGDAIAEEKVGDGRPLSERADTAAYLFEILSARSDIDHPICVECTELLVDQMQKRLASATKERDAYVDFLRNANADVPSEEEIQQAQKELDHMKEKEQKALAELVKLEKEKAALDKEIAALEEDALSLNEEEEKFWRDRNAFALTFAAFQNERDALAAKYDHDSQVLERLQRANVFNDTFTIGHDGQFGTINGLRLGRLSQNLVEWAEINAAWGQACLLLATVAERLGFNFEGYKLIPMGSTSTIERFEYPQAASGNDPAHQAKPKITTLELYNTGDLVVPFGFLHRRFDNAMIAFLDCLKQLGDYISQGQGSRLRLPYEIKKDKIHDMSIKLGFGQEENWTKACKYTLTCCKYLLAHASNVHSSARAPG